MIIKRLLPAVPILLVAWIGILVLVLPAGLTACLPQSATGPQM